MAERTSEDMARDVAAMRKWLNSQPHLPKDNVDDEFLARFVHSCYFDLEKAQTAAELFFTIRGNSPELMLDRDPLSPTMQKVLKTTNLAQIKTGEGNQIWIWQLNDPGLENYDYLQDAKQFILTTDAWLLERSTDFALADIVIMDAKDISLKFITKFNVSVARKISKYQEEAIPIRLKQVHVVNAPSFVDKLFALMKPFLKTELTELIHFHSVKASSANVLLDYFKKDELPTDYGGTLPSMAEYNKKVMDLIMKHRDKLNDDNLWRATSDKKSKKHKNNSTTSTQQEPSSSFRDLAID